VLRSARALAFSLRRGQRIGAAAVVVHAGSAVHDQLRAAALSQVREHLPTLLDEAESLGADAPRLLIEPTAGGGAALAADIASIAEYLDVVADERVGLCVDTCHLHASGHDLSSAAAMRRTLTELVAAVGAGQIGLLHVNDSRDPPGSLRDRHAAIGAGTIGAAAFGALFTTPVVRGVPMVVETEPAAQAGDVSVLKQLRDKRR
jgi:deoxyribonuclease IV